MSCFCRQFEINKNNRKTSVYKNRSEYLNVISKLNHVNQFIGRMSTESNTDQTTEITAMARG